MLTFPTRYKRSYGISDFTILNRGILTILYMCVWCYEVLLNWAVVTKRQASYKKVWEDAIVRGLVGDVGVVVGMRARRLFGQMHTGVHRTKNLGKTLGKKIFFCTLLTDDAVCRYSSGRRNTFFHLARSKQWLFSTE